MASCDLRVVGRVDHGEQLPGAPTVAQGREGHGRPDGAVGVLAAVLAHAGHVALDVAGFERRTCRRAGSSSWIRPCSRRTSRSSTACHGHARAFGIACPGEHRPALRDGIDLALARCRRSRAACRRRTRRGGTRRRPSRAARCSRRRRSPSAAHSSAKVGIAVPARQRAELAQHFVQEEAQPHALALALDAHAVHAVVPVAGADQRQAVRAESRARAGWPARSAGTGVAVASERPGRS